MNHIPVLLNEVLHSLAPKAGEIHVDGTFGAGGYSRTILQSADVKLFAIDRDPNVQPLAQKLEQEFTGRFVLLAGSFSQMIELLAEQGINRVDGIVLDIGVSSMQIDNHDRGFSFRGDGPLDMRMSQEGMSAADVVNSMEESALADILYHYGEERASRRIARAIVKARTEAPIERTKQLADIVRSVLPKTSKQDPATRTFQALRIHVNNELSELEAALANAETLLNPGGRLVVVTFHSLEDRIVKRFLESRCGETGGASRHLPVMDGPRSRVLPTFFCRKKGAVKVSANEADANPRARSAKLRWAVRTDAAIGAVA